MSTSSLVITYNIMQTSTNLGNQHGADEDDDDGNVTYTEGELAKENETIKDMSKSVSFDKDVDINVVYNQWGHHGERRLRKMASVHGFRLTSILNPCDACGIVKAS